MFSHAHGAWFEWDGKRWKKKFTRLAYDFARRMARKAARGEKTPSKSSFAKGVELMAKADPRLSRDGSAFDANNYLLNCPDGTYDLRTMTRQAHTPSDNITQITAVAPLENGGEAFRNFLREITLEDCDLEQFLQVSLGACLSGAVEDHWIIFWIGTGRNGKNTPADLVRYTLGDYAKKVPANVLMTSANERHPTELANLQGARLALSSEVEGGSFWADARIKELTGDETISARYMRGDLFQFERTHKHLVLGNQRPQVRNTDIAFKSRLRTVPFDVCFVGREDKSLPERLRKKASYVLHWLMQGHRKWLENDRKLGTCAAVDAETADYFSSQSTVDMWFAENCRMIPDGGRAVSVWPKSSTLYSNYSSWKNDRGEQAISQTRWGEQMKSLAVKIKSNGVRYVGVELMGNSRGY